MRKCLTALLRAYVSRNTLTLFPGEVEDTELDFAELFGNNLEVVNAGQAAQVCLLTEESATGEAYQGLRGHILGTHILGTDHVKFLGVESSVEAELNVVHRLFLF